MPPRLNPAIAQLRCSLSGRELPASTFSSPVGLCPCCPRPGKPLVVEYDGAAVRAALVDGAFPAAPGAGIWRYGPLLPVLDVPAGYAADVGLTATCRNASLSEECHVELFIKNEGTNPSGSFKDRGLAVAIALGVACGATRFCLPTQGNAGVAACLFAARLGLPGILVYMPEGFQGSIYHRACELFGGAVRFAGANIAAAAARMRHDLRALLERHEVVEVSTFFEPGRLEGKKTMGLEIAEHFGPTNLPEFIVYPTGGGTGLVGIWKAFRELVELGLVERRRLPRLVAVQSERCAPVVAAFRAGFDTVEPVTSRGTIADGLDVPGAIMGHAMLRALRESEGTAITVSEEAILAAFRSLGRAGVGASYEAAATLAALLELRRTGVAGLGARALLLATASHLVALARTQVVGAPAPG